MMKKYIPGISITGLIMFFSVFIFDSLFFYVKEDKLKDYFCSRTDNSYNVSVEYKEDEILIIDKIGQIETYKLQDFIKKLESCTKHRLLDSVIEKLKTKTAFNFAVNTKLNICGFYGKNFIFKEAYAYTGDIGNKKIIDILTDSSLGWLKAGTQDDDLVYSLIYLFFQEYYNNHYTLLIYNNFIIFYDFKSTGIFRLDIDYKKVFGVELIEESKNLYLLQVSFVFGTIFIRNLDDSTKLIGLSPIYGKFNNRIAQTLNKKYDGQIKKCLYEEKFSDVKNHLDIKKIKENDEFIKLLAKLKTTETFKRLLGSKIKS